MDPRDVLAAGAVGTGRGPSWIAHGAVLLGGFLAATGSAAAHAGALGGTGDPGPIPLWLVVLTGGALVAGSFLSTAFVTSRRDIGAVAGLRTVVAVPGALARVGRVLGGAVGVLGLLAVLGSGLFGPPDPTANLAVLLVWAGWWAGFTISVYLVGNAWPLLNPWRTLAELFPTGVVEYPERLGVWPAVVGLIALVAVEVVSPLATAPQLLALVVFAYTVVTLAGAMLVGSEEYFANVDPVAAVFALYGRFAPVGAGRHPRPAFGGDDPGPSVAETARDPSGTAASTADGGATAVGDAVVGAGGGGAEGESQEPDGGHWLTVGLPGVRLSTPAAPLGTDETAFVVALLWVTTFDGLVSTPLFNDLAGPLIAAGVPAVPLYVLAIVAGFGLFYGAYRLAAARARRTADTYVTARYLGGWFALSLVPIAAGYHLAHFLGYVLRFAPALAGALASPLASPAGGVTLIVVPASFGLVQLAAIVVGHLLAVWVAHVAAFRLFPGALEPLRSQYPLVLLMIGYTVASMWIVAQPYVSPVGL